LPHRAQTDDANDQNWPKTVIRTGNERGVGIMSGFQKIAAAVIDQALAEVVADQIPVFTFALYFDHESPALSVCVDTRSNSDAQILEQNAYSSRYFHRSIADGDFEQAKRWQANVGRNLSLGDFTKVNIARVELDLPNYTDVDCVALVRELMSREAEIRSLASSPDDLVFCCSTPEDEVGLVWSAVEQS